MRHGHGMVTSVGRLGFATSRGPTWPLMFATRFVDTTAFVRTDTSLTSSPKFPADVLSSFSLSSGVGKSTAVPTERHSEPDPGACRQHVICTFSPEKERAHRSWPGYNVKLFGKMDTGGGAAMNPPGTKGVGMHTEADWPRPPAYPSSESQLIWSALEIWILD